MSNTYYPIFLDLTDAPCLVVGGGRIAERKIEGLLAAGAQVTVVSPEVTPGIAQLAESGKVEWIEAKYSETHVNGRRLVIGSTNDPEANAQVYRNANALGIPVNVVDDPPNCSFIVPAIHSAGDIKVAVCTGGGAPGVSGRIRDELAGGIAAEYPALVDVLKKNRDRIRVLDQQVKREFWKRVKEISIGEYQGREVELRAEVESWVAQAERESGAKEK